MLAAGRSNQSMEPKQSKSRTKSAHAHPETSMHKLCNRLEWHRPWIVHITTAVPENQKAHHEYIDLEK